MIPEDEEMTPEPELELPAEETPPEVDAHDDTPAPSEKELESVSDAMDGDESELEEEPPSSKPPKKEKLLALLKNKKVSIPAAVILLLLILMAVPMSRYKVLGLALKQSVSVAVVDSVTHKPVTEVNVLVAGKSAKTNKNGIAVLAEVPLGSQTVTLTKKYYKTTTGSIMAGLSKPSQPHSFTLVATGRQISVLVTNKISGAPVENALIQAADAEARTDKTGAAVVVLPAGSATLSATITTSGYNKADVTIKIADATDKDNAFSVTPAGKIYFLSKKTGKVDVVKTDLDGSNRQTVLAGTGNEDDRNTVLLASRDWKYLALEAKRDSDLPKLYLIDTSTDKLSTIDEGNASFTLTGWSDHYFVYTVNRNDYQTWQPKQQSIKSYNAETDKLITLDNTDATGTGQYDAQHETYYVGTFALGDKLVFSKTWLAYYTYYNVPGKQNSLVSIDPDGSNRKTIDVVDGGTAFFSTIKVYEATELLIQKSPIGSGDSTFYTLTDQGTYSKAPDATVQTIYKAYPTFLQSPSGKQTFWSEQRDGKNTLFIGNIEAKDEKEIASLSEYLQYGWYTDNYLLVSKNGSELYILSKDGLKDGQTPYKIADYHKPAQNYAGYGGGYGGY